MSQTWRWLTFLHWPFKPSLVQALLPSELQVDTLEHTAWIGLIPFEIHNLRGIPRFPETNVRTYVVGPDGSRAVWFFSLDAARLLAVVGARALYHLPYVWARMRVAVEDEIICYTSRRRWSDAASSIVVKPGAPYKAHELGELDHFLTARYRLYSTVRDRLFCAQIEHEPWPLARATLVELHQSLIEAAGLPSPVGAPLVHHCDRLDVKIGTLTVIRP